MKYVLKYIMMLAAIAAVPACSIKEDRSSCPCMLTVDFPEAAAKVMMNCWNQERRIIDDVLELDGFGIAAIRHLADAVRPHPLIRDAVLGRFFLFIRAVGAGDSCIDLLPVGTGQLMFSFHRRRPACFTGLPVFLFREQCHTPPCRVSPAVPARRRSYWSGTGAPWAG